MQFFKNFLKNIGIFIGVFIVLGVVNIWYIGGFSRFEAKEQIMGPYTIVYTQFVGEYSKVGPSMTKVYEILSGAGILSNTGIGIYYDNPAMVSGVDLRSDIGAIITPQDAKKLASNKDIKITTFSAGNKIVVEFPIKNSLSYMIGPMKVYPVITKYMKEKGYTNKFPMVELYDMVGKKIYYITEIGK